MQRVHALVLALGQTGVELDASTIGKGKVGDNGGLGLRSLMLGESPMDLDLCLCIPPLGSGRVMITATAEVVERQCG